MKFNYEGKVAAVTGGAAGFGFGISKRLLEYGAEAVWLLDFNSLNLKKAEEELLKDYPGRVYIYQVDISAEGAVEKALDEVVSRSGHLDVLFNNAGRPMTKPVFNITPEEFRSLIALNYTGVVMGTMKAIEIMSKQGHGLIVSAGSAGGLVPMPYQCAYGSTKAAVIEFMRCLHYEFIDTDIHFAQYSPSNVATSIFSAEYAERLRREGKTEEEIAAAVAGIKPPADAMPLEEALDILFAGIAEQKVDIIIGDQADWSQKAYVNDREAFDGMVRPIGAARKEYYAKLNAAVARGESGTDIPFPG